MDQLLRFFLSNCRLACCIAIEGAGGGMEGGGSLGGFFPVPGGKGLLFPRFSRAFCNLFTASIVVLAFLNFELVFLNNFCNPATCQVHYCVCPDMPCPSIIFSIK